MRAAEGPGLPDASPEIARRKDENGKDIELKTGDIVQNSLVVPGRWWRISQTTGHGHSGQPRLQRESPVTRKRSGRTTHVGRSSQDDNKLAHRDNEMTCFACHSSWVTSCFGCHLSMEANREDAESPQRRRQLPQLHAVQLSGAARRHLHVGTDGTVTGHQRSAGSIVVRCAGQFAESESRMDLLPAADNSAEGFAGQAFNTHVPHTVRATRRRLAATATCRKEGQQCVARTGDAAGNELRQFHGAVCFMLPRMRWKL